MTKAIVSFATGTHREYLNLARPGFQAYARRHGYDYYEVKDDFSNVRHIVWFKIPAMLTALEIYTDVLWIDADVVIMDGSEDIADQIPPEAWQALVEHKLPWPAYDEVPNSGVWYVRQPMIPVLERCWTMTEYTGHEWPEQSALMDLMGYECWNRPTTLIEPTELYNHTHFLSLEWNSVPWQAAEVPRFNHAAGDAKGRKDIITEWAQQVTA